MKKLHLITALAFTVLSLPSVAVTQAEIDNALASQKVPLMCSRLFEALLATMDTTEPQKVKLKVWSEHLYRQAMVNVHLQIGRLSDDMTIRVGEQMGKLSQSEFREVMDSVNSIEDPSLRNKQLGKLVEACTNAAKQVMPK